MWKYIVARLIWRHGKGKVWTASWQFHHWKQENQSRMWVWKFSLPGSRRNTTNKMCSQMKHSLSLSLAINETSEYKLVCGKHRNIAYLDVFQKPHLLWREWSHSFLSFSEEAHQCGKGLLIHCQAGVSRSATIVIAYLMKHTRMTMTDAYKFVKGKRPIISPNLNFMGQLLEFEEDLNNGVTPRILTPKLIGVETVVWWRRIVWQTIMFFTWHRLGGLGFPF